MSARIIAGGHKDAWLSCDAYLMLKGIEGRALFTFYLPKGKVELGTKQVVLTDGTTMKHAILLRGKPNVVDFGPVSNTQAIVRVLCAYPEIPASSDTRELGVLLTSVLAEDRSGDLLEHHREAPAEMPELPGLPDFWLVQ